MKEEKLWNLLEERGFDRAEIEVILSAIDMSNDYIRQQPSGLVATPKTELLNVYNKFTKNKELDIDEIVDYIHSSYEDLADNHSGDDFQCNCDESCPNPTPKSGRKDKRYSSRSRLKDLPNWAINHDINQ